MQRSALGVVRQDKVYANLVIVEMMAGKLRGVGTANVLLMLMLMVLMLCHGSIGGQRRHLVMRHGQGRGIGQVGGAVASAFRDLRVTAGDAAARAGIVAAVGPLELDGSLAKVIRDAVLGENGLETGVLLHHPVALAGGVGEDFLETEDFLLEGFDVHLLAFSVCSLRLSIELLPPRERGFAVWFRASSLRRLAIWCLVSGLRWRGEGGDERDVPLVCFFSLLRFFNRARLLSGLMSPLPELAAEDGWDQYGQQVLPSPGEGTHCRDCRRTASRRSKRMGERMGGWVKG